MRNEITAIYRERFSISQLHEKIGWLIRWLKGEAQQQRDDVQFIYNGFITLIPVKDAKRLNKIIFEDVFDDIYNLAPEFENEILQHRVNNAVLTLQILKDGLGNGRKEAINEFVEALFSNNELVFTIFPCELLKRNLYVDLQKNSNQECTEHTYIDNKL